MQRMHLISSEPYDELSEALYLQGITNFVNVLSPMEVAGSISTTLTSIEEREGMLTDENARVSLFQALFVCSFLLTILIFYYCRAFSLHLMKFSMKITGQSGWKVM